MIIYMAGGESLPPKRQKALFEDGCRNRLVCFYAGNNLERVMRAKEAFESEKEKT